MIDSGSPYLLQHAHNPVDWYPWGEEAIAKAKKDNKLIFLSVGYSTCYWCHVAERTIYSNPEIAALMNKWFVNIKVDREERPDIDETYMLARQILTGSGGWPNNLFLTPDLKPFFAGSYFPPQDQDGRRGFPGILKLIHEGWKQDPAEIERVGDMVTGELARLRDSNTKPASLLRLRPGRWLTAARDNVLPHRDRVHGGFDGGGGTKFPQSPLISLLLTDYRLNGTADSLETVAGMLNAMSLGGIHDHLGGGMHRYSTEPTWSVPHFEKMLYDNAQLIGLYADYYAITRQPLARKMAGDIAGHLQRRLTAPEGGFYTAEDADIEGKEGETYLWTRNEITAALGEADASRLFALYELMSLPDDPGGPGVLRMRQDRTDLRTDGARIVESITDLAPLRAKLLAIRDRRQQPARDDKIVVSLNGLAIAGLSHAGTVFGEPQWIESARRAGEFLWRSAFDAKSGSLSRYVYKGNARGDGFLEDYALLGLGFVALGEATGEPEWGKRADALASAMMERFVKDDGMVVTAAADPTLIVPAIDLNDHDTPSGTSAAYELLAHLGTTTQRYADAATKIVAWMAPKLESSPDSWPSLVSSAAQLGVSPKTAAPAPLLDSAAYVKATAYTSSDAEHDLIAITLSIDPGYHINANPASLDYLIPTTVRVPGAGQAKVTYPPGKMFSTKFLDHGISVYEGSVTISVELPKGSGAKARHLPVEIEVQACTDEICLPPATISVPSGDC
ncbi:MAG: DUF255 domain-containing protein [Methyloceanibacter sp.]|uniref:DUF255 domain-containing protein n=1 Tax=Methyloceanibacter sp. TaxID=1965321 RepID=UPI003D6CCAD4